MNTLTSIAASGLAAAQTQLRASANNIANMNTEGYHRQEVLQAEQAQGGVSTSVVRAQEAGPDLVGDVVAQLQAKNAFLANVAVFKADRRMKGTLLDASA